MIPMMPKLGTKVYCIYGDGILVDTVGYLGKESFIINSIFDDTESDSWEWYYEEYEESWFTNLKKAQTKLKELYRDKIEGDCKILIKKCSDTWYELRIVEKGAPRGFY